MKKSPVLFFGKISPSRLGGKAQAQCRRGGFHRTSRGMHESEEWLQALVLLFAGIRCGSCEGVTGKNPEVNTVRGSQKAIVEVTIVFLLIFFILVGLTLWWSVPYIEGTLTERGRGVLTRAELRFAEVQADGRDLYVSGVAPDTVTKTRAIEVTQRVWGHRIVVDRLALAPAPPPPPPVAESPPRPKAPPAPVAVLSLRDLELQARLSEASRRCQERFDGLLSREKIRFAFGSTQIDSDSYGLLDALAEIAQACPEAKIEISGHTDDIGTVAANERVSLGRSTSVIGALVQRGLDPKRLTPVGHADRRPVASNDTDAGRALNRRIEFVVVLRRRDDLSDR